MVRRLSTLYLEGTEYPFAGSRADVDVVAKRKRFRKLATKTSARPSNAMVEYRREALVRRAGPCRRVPVWSRASALQGTGARSKPALRIGVTLFGRRDGARPRSHGAARQGGTLARSSTARTGC